LAGPPPEFRRPVSVRTLGRTPIASEIVADATECRAVAARLGLVAVTRLAAQATLRRRDDGAVVVTGRVEARVTQVSVVSLEAFEADAAEDFTTVFVPPDADEGTEVEIDPTEEEDIETLEGSSIDLGELAVQYLALALDPYPHAPGEEPPPEDGQLGDGQDEDA
jgi:uncharacterized metal-binding protein YceD (DUF177 family)